MRRRALLGLLPLATAACVNRGYGIGALFAGSPAEREERDEAARDVPFVPTPEPLVAAMLGGQAGMRFHRNVDAAGLDYR